MSCYSNFEFYAGEAKRLDIQVNSLKGDCKEPIGLTIPLAQASRILQDLTFTSLLKLGDTGNKIEVEYVGGGNAGLEVVSFSGVPIHVGQGVHVYPKIKVQIATGVSTATQIKAALEANPTVAKLLTIAVSGVGSNAQVVAASAPLVGGTGSSVEIELPTSGTNIFLDLTTTPQVIIDDAPLSKIHVDLNSDQTSLMIKGAILVRVTKQGKMSLAVASGASSKQLVPNC
jgi:hypothetical protein